MRVLNIYEEFVRKLLLKKSNVSLVDYMIYFSQRKEELGRSNSRSKTIKSTIKHIVNFSPESIPLNKVDKEVMQSNRNWENVLEGYYSFGIGSTLIITPDIQFYINPALNNKSHTATVASIRATFMF